jgi:HK97 family phage major capsid protein
MSATQMILQQPSPRGEPVFTGEGDDKPQASVRYEEREQKAHKVAVFGKVTTEMLRNLPRLVSYIQNNLMKRVDIKTEDKLFKADGTGDNIKGLTNYATQFDGGVGVKGGDGLVAAVKEPTNMDVIRAIALQVSNSYGIPSALFIDTDMAAQMDVEKDNQGRYIIPPFRSADGSIIAGIKLIPTTALTGTGVDFVGGDLSVINVGFTDTMSIQIGTDGNDFTQNKKTIIVEQELVQFVSANDTQVLVKGTFAAAKTLLTLNAIPEA